MINKKIMLSIMIAGLLGITLFFRLQPRRSLLVWAVGSTPDGYGNYIHEVFFERYNTTSSQWEVIYELYTHDGGGHFWNSGWGNITENTYSSGFTLLVTRNEAIRFGIYLLLNDTLATTMVAARLNTRVWANLTTPDDVGNWTNQLMNDYEGCSAKEGSFYIVWYKEVWNSTANLGLSQDHPAEGEIYEITYRYEIFATP